jgi:outer membrane autotransporter protein
VLVFDHSDSLLVSNVIGGTGSLTQAGTGTLILSNVNTYSGGTWVSDGGTLTVLDNHALGRGSLNVIEGTLRISTSQVVYVGASYTQAANGTLEIGIGATNAFGQLNIADTASLDGTVHVVQASSYIPQHNDQFVLVTASNGVTGTFSTLTNDIAHSSLLNPELGYSADDVTLKWMQLSFVPYAKTANQLAVARYLDGVSSSTASSAVQTINYLDYVSDPTNGLPLAYSQIAPEELGAVFTIAFAEMDAQGSRFLARANELRADYRRLYTDLYNRSFAEGAAGDTSLAQPSEDLFQRSIGHQWNFYVEPGAQFVDVKGDSNANGYSQSGSSVTAGLDRRVSEQLVLGGAVSYLGDDASLDQGGKINADTGFLELYGAWFSQGLHLEGMIGGGLTSYSTTRQALQGEAKGNTDALIWTGLVGGGYDWQRGSWSFGPQAVIQYEWASMDSFTETGSLAPLEIQSQIEDALHTQLGFTARHRGNLASTWTFVTPEVTLAWRHDYLDDSMPVTAQLASGAGGSFTVHGPKLGTDSVVGSFGITAQWKPTVSTYLNYIAQLGRSGYTAHTISVGLRVGF